MGSAQDLTFGNKKCYTAQDEIGRYFSLAAYKHLCAECAVSVRQVFFDSDGKPGFNFIDRDWADG